MKKNYTTKLIIADLLGVLFIPDEKSLGDMKINFSLLNFLDELKSEINTVVLTSTFLTQSSDVRNILEKVTTGIFFSDAKGKPETYANLIEHLETDTSEVMFIDDSQYNLDSAKQAGIEKTFLFNYLEHGPEDIEDLL